MGQIVSEGISGFIEKTGKQVFYKRSSTFRDKNYYLGTIEDISKFTLELPNPEKAAETLSESFPPVAKLVYYSSNSRISQFEDLFDLSSGLYSIIEKKYPEQFDKQSNVKDFTEYFSILRVEGKEMINNATSYVETASKKEGKAVSASVVLEYFLIENDGDLGKSVYDTHLYLKFMARNNRDTGFNNPDESNVNWMRSNIKDEYQGPSYAELNEDSINNLGKPYHSWNLVAMLQFFPVELIRASGIYRQIITLKDQGLGKTRADLQTLKDLREIENVLLDHS